jgi:hypothetical protein
MSFCPPDRPRCGWGTHPRPPGPSTVRCGGRSGQAPGFAPLHSPVTYADADGYAEAGRTRLRRPSANAVTCDQFFDGHTQFRHALANPAQSLLLVVGKSLVQRSVCIADCFRERTEPLQPTVQLFRRHPQLHSPGSHPILNGFVLLRVIARSTGGHHVPQDCFAAMRDGDEVIPSFDVETAAEDARERLSKELDGLGDFGQTEIYGALGPLAMNEVQTRTRRQASASSGLAGLPRRK